MIIMEANRGAYLNLIEYKQKLYPQLNVAVAAKQ